MGKSNYLEQALLDHVINSATLSAITTLYVSVYETDPTDANTGTETSYTGYTRQLVAFSRTGSTVDNDADINFPENTGSSVTVTHFGVHDAVTAGNLLYHGSLDESKQITNGDELKIKAGELDISED